MTISVTRKIHFSNKERGRREILQGPAPIRNTSEGRVPRIARLMALAIHFEELIRTGGIRDQAELAHVGHVSRARVTQIMNLLYLAPDIQEDILFLPRIVQGDDPIPERKIRDLVKLVDWAQQRQMWQRIHTLTCQAGR